ncbi:MAG TPA: hypothetical protein VNO23_16605 [Candidatus Binatia bacterium]|nr:hypothetical protein [Candidatus Binatia bacterium]
MAGAERAVTFVVRLVQSGDGGVRGTVERVKTGRKEQIRAVEDIARVIAAMAREEPSASDGGDEGDGS